MDKNRKILVAMNMFQMDQFIFLPDTSSIKVTLKELPEAIVNTCYQQDVYKVDVLKGPALFVSKVIKDVKKKELLMYNTSKIEIKGVK
jgi:hypoxanthine-guanine phosphoribosyltransferase